MREINFRAWDKEEGVMRSVSSLIIEPIYTKAEFGSITPTHIDVVIPNDQFIVMQYTGLHDKNGKEIYEGDIVKAEDGVWQILVNDLADGIVLIHHQRQIISTEFDDGTYHLGETEIIGNIYENKELLK